MDIHDGQHIDVTEEIITQASRWASNLISDLN